jgi:hypothetical protein
MHYSGLSEELQGILWTLFCVGILLLVIDFWVWIIIPIFFAWLAGVLFINR